MDWNSLARDVAAYMSKDHYVAAREMMRHQTGLQFPDNELWMVANLWAENPEQAGRELRMFAFKKSWKGRLRFADIRDYVADKTVAVVGNATSFVGAGYGEAIDSHDIVVRINAGVPRPDRAADFGTKMNVWGGISSKLISDLSISKGKKDPAGIHTKTIIDLDSWNDRVDQVWYVPWGPRPIATALEAKTYGLFDEWFLAREYKGSNPTSGFALTVMLSRCEPAEVSLYGFDFFLTPSLDSGRNPGPTRKHDQERLCIRNETDFTVHNAPVGKRNPIDS